MYVTRHYTYRKYSCLIENVSCVEIFLLFRLDYKIPREVRTCLVSVLGAINILDDKNVKWIHTNILFDKRSFSSKLNTFYKILNNT